MAKAKQEVIEEIYEEVSKNVTMDDVLFLRQQIAECTDIEEKDNLVKYLSKIEAIVLG